MENNVLKRTTFVVNDAIKAAAFYQEVFGWTTWYDNIVKADHRFPPSGAEDKAEVRLIILESPIGKLGLLSYLNSPFEIEKPPVRQKIKMGEPILVLNTDNVNAIYEKAKNAGANVVTGPVEWTVPGANGKPKHMRSISIFDPNGIYMEISQHLN